MRLATAFGVVALACACSTLPEPEFTKHEFPKDVFLGNVKRPYEVLGEVKYKLSYATLDPNHEEAQLCANSFNQAAKELLRIARENGADAVLDLKSVVQLFDGRVEFHAKAECSDDGAEGQVAVRGVAVRWRPQPLEEAGRTPSPQ